MKKAVLLAVLAILTSRPLFAQSTTEGAIGGLVVDQSKAVLPGVTVTARNVATNSATTTTTDESGHFTVIRLQPGTYAVEVTLSGFAPYMLTLYLPLVPWERWVGNPRSALR